MHVLPIEAGSAGSSPQHWDELRKRIEPRDFTMEVALRRCTKHGDLFAPVLEEPRSLAAAARSLASLG